MNKNKTIRIPAFIYLFLFFLFHTGLNAQEPSAPARPVIKVSKSMLKSWKEALEFGVAAKRISVIKSIIEHNDKKTFSLIGDILKNDLSDKVKEAAVKAVRQLKYKEALDAVYKLLESQNNALVTACLYTLSEFKYKKAAGKIIKLLDNDNRQLKIAAITAAGFLKAKNVLKKLNKLAKELETNDQIREAAIVALGRIGDKSSLPVLKEIFDNPAYSKWMKMYAVTSFGLIGGDEAFKYLKKAFASNEYFLRLRAVEAMSRINNPEVANYIKEALRDENEKIRIEALKAIKRMSDKSKFFRHIKYMIHNESKPSVQREAVIAYLQIGGSEAIDFVNKTIKKQGNQFLKYYIVLGLERIEPDKALSKLADIYKTNYDLGMRLQIAKSIYNLNTEKRISVLEDLAKLKRKDDKESLESYRKGRINILNMFTKFEGSKVLSLLKTIIKDKNEDPWIRQHCVRLLPAVREKLGLPYIYDLIDDNSLEPADTAGKAINGIAVQLAGDFRSREVGADEALIKKTIKKLKKLFLKSGQSLLSFSYRHSLIKLGISAEVLDAAKKKLENRNSTSERIRQQENARARAHSTTAARPEASNTRGRATQSRVPERYDTNGR